MWEVCSWEKHGLWLFVGWSGFSPLRITVDVRAGRGVSFNLRPRPDNAAAL